MSLNLTKSYGKEFFWVIAGQSIAVLGAIFSIKIITSLVTPDVFGYFSYYMTFALGFNQILFGPLSGSFFRFYSVALRNNTLPSFFLSTRKILLKSSAIILTFSLALVLIGLVFEFRFNYIFFTLLIFYIIFSGFYASVNSIHSAQRNRKLIAILGSIEPVIRVFLVFFFLNFIESNSIYLMGSYALSACLILILSFYFLGASKFKSKEFPFEDLNLKSQILKYSKYTSYFGIFTWIYLSSDKWILEYFYSNYEVGIYAVLLQLGYYPMSIISGVLIGFLSPIYFDKIDSSQKNYKRYDLINKKITFGIILFTGFIAFIARIKHEFIFKFLTGGELYSEYSYLLPLIIIAGGIFGASQLLTLTYQYKLEMKKLMMGKIITSCIGLFINFIGIYYYGIFGLAISSIIFSLISLIYFIILPKYRTGN